ncbi:hypothetical protein [Streptomyces sp. NPDC020917]|uniref:hypothetical protein n=1 Tax=Streptomyces sp. NPDC020917 TaxID=3365102 RepID=UPI003794953C
MFAAYVPSPQCYRACPAGGGAGDLTTFLIVAGSVVGAVLVGWMVKVELDHRLRTRGVPGTAVITALEGRRVVPGTPDMKVTVTLLVTAPDGEELETWTTAQLPILDMPRAGWRVPVRYSARDRYRVALTGPAVPPEEESAGAQSPGDGPGNASTTPPASPSHPMER